MVTVIEPVEVSSRAEPEGLYEGVGTTIVEKPPIGAFEAGFACWLFELMGPIVRASGLGQLVMEVLFDLRPAVDRERRPDLAFVSARSCPLSRRPPRRSAWRLVPEL